MMSLKLLLTLAISGALAAPAALQARQDSATNTTAETNSTAEAWDVGAVTQYPIHSSCNATQRHQLETGLNETIELAQHARDHVLRWGNNSDIYRQYFGDRPPFEVIGAYDILVDGDKGDVLFRCDNPDGNCDLEGWGGHWRGENATGETVICDLSYETRRSLNQMCALGYTVAQSPANTFWASDLMHRLYHMPALGWEYIEHYAEDYDEVIELAAGNETYSTHDSDTLQFFALEVYAHDVAVPGEGCPGTLDTESSHDHDDASASSSAAATSASGSPTQTQAPSTTSSLPANCHTHDGGDVHCT